MRRLIQGQIRWLLMLSLVVLALLASLSLARGAANALGIMGEAGSLDLATYWQPVRAMLGGADPYQVELSGTDQFLGDDPPAVVLKMQPAIPANLPVQLLLLAPLAHFNWPAWRLAFLFVNLAAALIAPLVLFRLLARMPGLLTALLALFFWSMLPTRNALANGQLSLVVLATAVLAIWLVPRNQWLAGVALGLALTKYSLSLPILLWFIVFGAGWALILALSIQIFGTLGVAAVSGSSIQAIGQHYVQMLLDYPGLSGEVNLVGLAEWIGFPRIVPNLAWLIFAAIGLVALLVFFSRQRSFFSRFDQPQSPRSLLLFSFLLLSALPFVYHRNYDAVLMIVLPLAVWAYQGVLGPKKLSSGQAWWLALILLAPFLLPRYSFSRIWPTWESVVVISQGLAVQASWLLLAALLVMAPRLPDELNAI